MNRKNVHLLATGAYVARDYALLGFFKNRMYKWAYFTDVAKYDAGELMKKKACPVCEIVWVGRFIELKQPDVPLRIVRDLSNEGKNVHLTMLGNGVLWEQMKVLAQEFGISDKVDFVGAVSASQTGAYYEKANIHLFTSDWQEGWGAVVNESMSRGCVCIARHCIGAVPFLIKDGENGIIVDETSYDEMLDATREMVTNREKCKEIGKRAYLTMSEEWNATNAVKNLAKLIDAISKNQSLNIEEGPCSKAVAYKQRKMLRLIKEKKIR